MRCCWVVSERRGLPATAPGTGPAPATSAAVGWLRLHWLLACPRPRADPPASCPPTTARFVRDFDPEVQERTPEGLAKLRALSEAALAAGGLHVAEGGRLWGVYREWEQQLLAEAEEAAAAGGGGGGGEMEQQKGELEERVRSLFLRQIKVGGQWGRREQPPPLQQQQQQSERLLPFPAGSTALLFSWACLLHACF